jgi:predicted NAD/FAD-dependent oxidoreductase
MRVVVVGAGMAGLAAARRLSERGHEVTVMDKGRRPGGRLATRDLGGGARADHGAQFFTVRSDEFATAVDEWIGVGLVREWCRGFARPDGHPRYACAGGMAELGRWLGSGLDVRVSLKVSSVTPGAQGVTVSWEAGHSGPARELDADAVVMTAPVPQAASLLPVDAALPDLAYAPTISLVVALSDPGAVPEPGGVQLGDHPVWSWIGDNRAKGASTAPSLTFHTRADVAAERWDGHGSGLEEELLAAAAPWLGGSRVLGSAVHRWRYATPLEPYPSRCFTTCGGRVVVAGDAFGGPRVEGAFLSGLAAADALPT